MDNEESTVVIYSTSILSSQDIKNLRSQMEVWQVANQNGLDVPKFGFTLPKNNYIRIRCFNHSAVLCLASIVNNWPDQQLNIVYEEFFEELYMVVFIPEIGLDEHKVLRQFKRNNDGLSTCHWKDLQLTEQTNGTRIRIKIDFDSFVYIESMNRNLPFKNYCVEVELSRGNNIE